MDIARIGPALIAVAIVLVVDLAAFYLVDGPVARSFMWGSALGLAVAIGMQQSMSGWSWPGFLAFLGFVALYVWIGWPLLGSRPIFEGFDGSNPVALLPGLLHLGGLALAFVVYGLIARPRQA
jgi:hypothetical protein